MKQDFYNNFSNILHSHLIMGNSYIYKYDAPKVYIRSQTQPQCTKHVLLDEKV